MQAGEASDSVLLQQISANDSGAFACFYNRYGHTLYRFALMLSGSSSMAEEVVQETFVFVLESPLSYDDSRSATALAWLYGVARNRLRPMLRQQARTTPAFSPAFSPALLDEQAGQRAETIFELDAAAAATLNAILDLPLAQREVVILCGIQQLEYTAAAEVLGVPVGTVRSRLSRARRRLRCSLFAEVGFQVEELTHG